MYVNLLLGAVALVVLWLYVRKILVRDGKSDGRDGIDALRERPVDLLEKEVARRRAAENETSRVFERLRDTGTEHMRTVVAALDEIYAALPSVIGGSCPDSARRLRWEDAGDSVTVRIRAADGKDEATLVVSWRIPDLDLRNPGQRDGGLSGEYFLRRSDAGREERIPDLEGCIRAITAFIVDFMA
ncbi:MAG: hypothetical protein LIP28_09660 [Deltaproteobacteria bacterium]|nr:hypothetical protein [Deltaproteobacteria bacterium]